MRVEVVKVLVPAFVHTSFVPATAGMGNGT